MEESVAEFVVKNIFTDRENISKDAQRLTIRMKMEKKSERKNSAVYKR